MVFIGNQKRRGKMNQEIENLERVISKLLMTERAVFDDFAEIEHNVNQTRLKIVASNGKDKELQAKYDDLVEELENTRRYFVNLKEQRKYLEYKLEALENEDLRHP